MASFLGKTVTAPEANRLRAAHRGKVSTEPDVDLPTLAEVEAHYLQAADNEVTYYERDAAARALPEIARIGLKDK